MKGKWLLRALLTGLVLSTLIFAGCDDGDDGDNGAPGLSSYQAAVEQGLVDPEEVTEEEFYAALTAAAEAASTPLAPPNESCNVCHGEGKDISIDNQHPELPEEPVISGVTLTRAGDNTLTVDFTVTSIGGPVTGIGAGTNGSSGSDLRVYLADIVPAGTTTVNAPQMTWPTAFPEMYAETRGSDATVTYSEVAGTYTYVINSAILGTDFDANAPEGDLTTHMQRVYIRADPRDFREDLTRTAFVADFMMPAAGAATLAIAETTTRTIVDESACIACHNDPLQEAGHGGGYQSPQVCVMCHSPIGSLPEGGELLGDVMQDFEAWSASLFHKIHAAIDMPAFPTRINGGGYSEVTFPKQVNDCEVCHFDNGQDLADYWKTNPSIEACTTCHEDTTFGATATHSGGSQTNASCTFCHPADGAVTGVIFPVSTVHQPDNTLAYESTISLSADANSDGVYEVGEEILVTVTTSNVAAGDYAVAGAIDRANVYVYGPRALAVPVLTPGSTTDPDFVLDLSVDPTITPDQGRSILIDDAADDAQIRTDADGFKYQLFPITEDMEPGTYMVQTYVTTDVADCSEVYRGNTCIDGWDLVTFQVGTATEEKKVAGECTSCHDQERWGTMYHRSYFGTDGCNACHDQSGNHADPLTNRVHAVHAATVNGDLLGNDWSEITFPQDITSCVACHNSGNDTYREEPKGSFSYACIGCHGDTTGARGHMEQNGAPFPTD